MSYIIRGTRDSATASNGFVDSFAQSEIVTGDVILDQTIKLPEWVDRSAAVPEEQAAWERMMGDLTQHEGKHAEINRKQADKLDKALPGTTGFGNAPTPQAARMKAALNRDAKIKTKQRQNRNETVKRHREFDAETDHGRKNCTSYGDCAN
jgi:predicted secreted Zn-dependent protease